MTRMLGPESKLINVLPGTVICWGRLFLISTKIRRYFEKFPCMCNRFWFSGTMATTISPLIVSMSLCWSGLLMLVLRAACLTNLHCRLADRRKNVYKFKQKL